MNHETLFLGFHVMLQFIPAVARPCRSIPVYVVVEYIAGFLSFLERRTDVRLAVRLIRIFHDEKFDILPFRYKIRNIYEWTKLTSHEWEE